MACPDLEKFGVKERRIEDVALKRLLSKWKQDNEFPRPFNSKKANSKSRSSQASFIRRLKVETLPDVKYEALPSPEFKQGQFYILPCNVGKSRNYKQVKAEQGFSSVCSKGQLCRGMKRRIFCEVMGDETLCFDCNGREIRTKFNAELQNEFPYLEYDQITKPYGFCPRAIRLTEPLPMRGFYMSHHNCDCTRTKSALLPKIKPVNYEQWLTKRPFTN
jgi:hypothetical protein